MSGFKKMLRAMPAPQQALAAGVSAALLYVLSGKLSLMLALPPGYASPIFPPAGIALAAAFIAGRSTWAWIFLGSLLLNIWVAVAGDQHIDSTGLAVAAIIAAASTLQAALGGWGLRRLIAYPATLIKVRDAASFLLLVPFICLVSATLSVTGLWALDVIEAARFAGNWSAWWFGDTLGALVMFPLIMIVAGGARESRRERLFTVVLPISLVLTAGLVSIYLLQNAAYEAVRKNQQDEFEYQAREIVLRIEQRLHAYEQTLRGVRGLYVASERVDQGEFRAYVNALALADNYPGIQAVGYAMVIPAAERARHVQTMRREGLPDYSLYPGGERDVYTSVIHLEPFSVRNRRVIGYDMFSETVRRTALEQARDSDRSVMTGKVRLLQEDEQEEQSGFLMGLPVYQPGRPHATVAERRANIAGWIYAAFRMNDLMQGILGRQVRDFDLEIYDNGLVNADTMMYDSRSEQPHPDKPLFALIHRSELVGHAWTVRLHSLPKFEQDIDTGRITVIRIGGLLLSVLLSLLVWQLASGRARAIELAKEMTCELHARGERLNEAQRMAHIGSWTLDVASGKLNWSDEIYRIFEIDPARFGASYEAFLHAIHPEDRDLVDAAYAESVRSRTPYSIEHRLLMEDGRIKFVHEKGETLYDEEGQAFRSMGTVQDITVQKITQERIAHLAYFDTLTNLPNRALFYDRLRQSRALARRNKSGLSLLYMDLDGFKQVNDTLGHHAGDRLLIAVAERLRDCVRESDTVARLGGDEFTILLNELHRDEDVTAIAGKIIQAISVPFDLADKQASIGISIGIARYAQGAGSEDELIAQADRAMYEAKQAGKNTFRFASSDAS